MRSLQIVAFLLLVGASTALADLTIEMKHDGEVQTMLATRDKLSVPTNEGIVVFRGDKKVLWMVDLAAGTYRELTEADLKKIGDRLAEAKVQMEEALKNVPPEQRAMVEKMMSEQAGALMRDKPAKTIKPLGQSRKINGFQTSGYEVYREGVLREEVWAAEPKALGLKADDFAVFQQVAEFMSTMAPGMEEVVERYMKNYAEPDEDDVPGFPVLTIGKTEEGTDWYRSELVRIDKDAIAAEKFELPAGFKKVSLDFGD